MDYLRIINAVLVGVTLIFPIAETASAEDEKRISVLTWNVPYLSKEFDLWVDIFHESHPDVTVERFDVKGTEWSTYYQTRLISGEPPDVIVIQGGLWLQYASQGGLVDLTPYLRRDAEFAENLYPEYQNNWVYEGKNYGICFFCTKTLLFYNKKMFADAGITRPPESFAELMDYSRKMTVGKTSGFATVNFDWLYWPLFAMNDVELLTPDRKSAAFNTPRAVEVVETLARATQEGVILKTSWTGRWTEILNHWAAGNVAMLHVHSTAYLWFKGKADWVNEETVGVAHMPGGWSTPNYHGMMISKGSRFPDIAWDFIKIATSGEGAYALGKASNNLVGDQKVNAKLLQYFEQNMPELVAVQNTQLEHLDKLVGNWPIAKDAQVKEAFYAELQNALLGNKNASTALADAESAVNRILRRR